MGGTEGGRQSATEAELLAALDTLEVEIGALRLRWWHLILWFRSPIRPLEERFRHGEAAVRATIDTLRRIRETNVKTMEHVMGPHVPGVITVAHLQVVDRENALSSRLERVRFLLLSKDGEAHARRSVLLGVVGVVLGIVSLVISLLPLTGWLR